MSKKLISAVIIASGLLWLVQSTPAYADPAAVKQIYGDNCKKCHGWDGKGDTAEGRKYKLTDLSSADYQKKATDDKIIKAITEGETSPDNPKAKMKAYKDKISEAQIKELLGVVRAFGKAPGPYPNEK